MDNVGKMQMCQRCEALRRDVLLQFDQTLEILRQAKLCLQAEEDPLCILDLVSQARGNLRKAGAWTAQMQLLEEVCQYQK